MIKGARKQMIVVRTGESRYFDEAYFVLRRDITPKGQENGDIISEANRILKESETGTPHCRRFPRSLLLFLAGLIAGAAVAGVILLIVL